MSTDSSLSYSSSDQSNLPIEVAGITKRSVNAFRIMTITRGYTDEADRIMNYLENGIFDALQKQYLRSFIFAIYLDSKEPNNIVEAYTFDFHYYTIPGTNTTVPIMNLGEGLRKLSISGGKHKDPVAEAARLGRSPTLKEVKQSVKALLKTLIHATQQLDLLPKRRYATFKLLYTDETPSNYEPPHFRAGNADEDKWFFMTHDLDEVPDKWSIGKVYTGHHSVNVSVASIAAYLPSSRENDDALFSGTTSRPAAPPTMTPVQEARVRVEQIERQKRDAQARNVAWSADSVMGPDDVDAEGDPDPEYEPQVTVYDSNSLAGPLTIPYGVRDENGDIRPLGPGLYPGEQQYAGISEDIPTKLQGLYYNPTKLVGFSETQILTQTQELPGAESADPHLAVQVDQSPEQSSFNLPDVPDVSEDAEMFDAETQRNERNAVESISSFSSRSPSIPIASFGTTVATNKTGKQSVDNGLDCDCGIVIEDQCCFCEGGCARWFHIWCMGYHSIKDERLPSKFQCLDCRIRADISWDLLQDRLHPQMMIKFKELALFRRAIKIAEKLKQGTLPEFTKSIGCENALARHLFTRLQNENFLLQHTTCLDDFGMAETKLRTVRGGKSKPKAKPRKITQKTKYVFNRQIKETAEYTRYFSAEGEAEHLGLINWQSSTDPHLKKLKLKEIERPTQDESQYPDLPPSTSQKRSLFIPQPEGHPPKKKVKISVTPWVDLAE